MIYILWDDRYYIYFYSVNGWISMWESFYCSIVCIVVPPFLSMGRRYLCEKIFFGQELHFREKNILKTFRCYLLLLLRRIVVNGKVRSYNEKRNNSFMWAWNIRESFALKISRNKTLFQKKRFNVRKMCFTERSSNLTNFFFAQNPLY